MNNTQLRPCGTDAAFARHVRHGEEPCVECRTARNEAQVRRRQLRLRHATPEGNPDADAVWDDTAFDKTPCQPWTGSHDSRQTNETDREFNTRLAAARTICRTCPAVADCRRRARHLVANQLRIDGIFAGQHHRHRGGDTA